MTILVIDTCLSACQVGLFGAGIMLAGATEPMERGHQERLAPMAADVMAGERFSDLSKIVVTIGPGSFTGLRIGLSAGKGLCASLGISLLCVPTFDAVAWRAFQQLPGVNALMICTDARQGLYFLGTYDRARMDHGWKDNVRVLPFGEIIPSASGVEYAVVTDSRSDMESIFDSERVFDDIQKFWCGESVALLGERMLLRGDRSNLDEAEPLYLRDFVVRRPPTLNSEKLSHGVV